jgi:hypothetical protein
MSPISPKCPPARSSAISTPFFSITTRPRMTTNSSSPGWPSMTISRPAGNVRVVAMDSTAVCSLYVR